MEPRIHISNGEESHWQKHLLTAARIVFILLIIFSAFISRSFSQVVIVKWDFPGNPDDSVADGGIPVNAGKTIGTRGGAGTATFGHEGFTTRAGGSQQWANGANLKCWQTEISTLQYGKLTIRSKHKSHHPQDFGPRDWAVQYRIGTSGTWTTIATLSIRTGNQWDSVPVTPLPTACNNQPSLYLRWIMTSNTPTQGTGNVNTDAYNYIDDVVVFSNCTPPTVAASPVAQTSCPGAAITPVLITNPNNLPGTVFSWTRDNTSALTGIASSGTANPITGTLNSISPATLLTTTFTITAEADGCTSQTTATVTVGDNIPPMITGPVPSVHFCVQDIIVAFWNFAGDITPIRPDWYTLHHGDTDLDINPASFSDNCSLPSNMILHWRIDLVGGAIISGIGQISAYPNNIIFPLGTSTVTYWLEDQVGNLTPLASRPVRLVIVHARPDITRNF
jgi:hypothetical protein